MQNNVFGKTNKIMIGSTMVTQEHDISVVIGRPTSRWSQRVKSDKMLEIIREGRKSEITYAVVPLLGEK